MIVNGCSNCYDSDSFCLSLNCPDKDVKHLFCDECGEESEDLYLYYGEELCESCLRKSAIIGDYYND